MEYMIAIGVGAVLALIVFLVIVGMGAYIVGSAMQRLGAQVTVLRGMVDVLKEEIESDHKTIVSMSDLMSRQSDVIVRMQQERIEDE